MTKLSELLEKGKTLEAESTPGLWYGRSDGSIKSLHKDRIHLDVIIFVEKSNPYIYYPTIENAQYIAWNQNNLKNPHRDHRGAAEHNQ